MPETHAVPNVRTRIPSRVLVASLATALAWAATAATAQEAINTPSGPGFLIYGNYCGPGNRGPAYRPIDALDTACMHHDACWPDDPAVLPSCTCNDRLHVEAGRVARDPRAPQKTRETARFISDFATALPCKPAAMRAGR